MKIITAILIALLPLAAHADKYLRASATGAGTGANWTDAYTTITAAETGTTRGETCYVAAGSYGSCTFDTIMSGTTLITFRKATVASHGTSTGWSDSYASGQAVFQSSLVFATGHWLFDGVYRDDNDWFSGTGYGFVINDNDNVQIEGRGNYNVTNINIHYTYLKGINTSPGSGGDIGRRGIYLQQFDPVGYYPNWTISHCFFQYGNVPIHARAAYGMTIEYTAFADNWSTQPNNHGENLSAYEANNHDFIIRFNKSRNMIGTAAWAVNNTTANNWKVYGNVYEDCEFGDGFIGWQGGSQSGITIYNETIIRPQSYTLMCGLGSGNTIQNCIFMMGSLGAPSFQGTTPSYNTYSGSGSGANAQTSFSTANFVNYAGGDYRLVNDTAAGLTLSAPYNTDITGATRTEPFSRGAYEYDGAPGDTTPPTCSLTLPTNSTVATGFLPMAATASDDTGVAGVRFYLDATLLADDTGSPYTNHWDSTTVLNGSYMVYAQARDAAGNVGYSATNTITVSNTVTLPDPAIYWTFDEDAGTTATDEVYSNVLTLQNGATWATGRFGAALSLDGTNDRADAPNSASLDITAPALTVAVWVNLTSTADWQQIIAKVKETGAFTSPYFAWHLFGGHFSGTQWTPMFQVVNSGGTSVNAASAVAADYGAWVHLAGVYDGATVKVYVNGVERGSAAQTGDIISYAQPLYVGSHGLPAEFAEGLVDDLRIYTNALTAAQVDALYALTPDAPGITVPPFILQQPTGLRLTNLQSGTLEMEAGGTEPLSYQWRLEGTNLPAATTNSYAIASAEELDAGDYVVVITNAAGAITSAVAAVEVIMPPALLVSPVATNIFIGSSLSLTSAVSSAESTIWRKDGVGQKGNTNQFVKVAALSDSGLWTFFAQNEAGTVESAPVRVFVFQSSNTVATTINAVSVVIR